VITAHEFLKALFAPADIIEFRCIPLKDEIYNKQVNPNGKFIQSYWGTISEYPEIHAKLVEDNRNNLGVYFGVAPRNAYKARKNINICPHNVIWIDIDDGVTVAQAIEKLKAVGYPEPNVAVATGNGAHCYWMLNADLEPRFIRTKIERMVSVVGGDATCKNEERVLRVPGFTNTKPNRGNTVTVVKLDVTTRYSPDLFPNADANPIPAQASPEFTEREWDAAELLETQRRAALYINTIPGCSSGAGQHQTSYKVANLLRRDYHLPYDMSLQMLIEWDKRNTPPLGRDECIKQLRCAELHGKHEPGAMVELKKDETVNMDNAIWWDTQEPEELTWVWRNKIPANKLTIIAGDPGCGKTYMICDLVSRLTTGRPMPDGTMSIGPCNVLVQSQEDGLRDTLIKRVIGQGGDRRRIASMKKADFNFVTDLQYLSNFIQQHNIKVAIFDPITNYIGSTRDNSGTELRAVLTPVLNEMERLGCTTITPHHYNKAGEVTTKMLYRVCGSIAYGGMSRAVWCVCADKFEPERKFLLPAKFNIDVPPTGAAYRIISKMDATGKPYGFFEWDTTFDGLMTAEDAEDHTQLQGKEQAKAVEFLQKFLANGEKLSREVMVAAENEGISIKAIGRRSVKDAARVISKRVGNCWMMQLISGKNP
jgi:putative DNA primase/helicase